MNAPDLNAHILDMKSSESYCHRYCSPFLLLPLWFCGVTTDMLVLTISSFFYLPLVRFKDHLTVNFNCAHSKNGGLENFSPDYLLKFHFPMYWECRVSTIDQLSCFLSPIRILIASVLFRNRKTPSNGKFLKSYTGSLLNITVTTTLVHSLISWGQRALGTQHLKLWVNSGIGQ